MEVNIGAKWALSWRLGQCYLTYSLRVYTYNTMLAIWASTRTQFVRAGIPQIVALYQPLTHIQKDLRVKCLPVT